MPISFDNPSVEYHKVALQHYDRKKSGPPILNSVAASRTHLEEMIELVRAYDTHVIVMASEHFVPGGTSSWANYWLGRDHAANRSPSDVDPKT